MHFLFSKCWQRMWNARATGSAERKSTKLVNYLIMSKYAKFSSASAAGRDMYAQLHHILSCTCLLFLRNNTRSYFRVQCLGLSHALLPFREVKCSRAGRVCERAASEQGGNTCWLQGLQEPTAAISSSAHQQARLSNSGTQQQMPKSLPLACSNGA
jgi:hypothetical protein